MTHVSDPPQNEYHHLNIIHHPPVVFAGFERFHVFENLESGMKVSLFFYRKLFTMVIVLRLENKGGG
jgi:hypothetical protein